MHLQEHSLFWNKIIHFCSLERRFNFTPLILKFAKINLFFGFRETKNTFQSFSFLSTSNYSDGRYQIFKTVENLEPERTKKS